MMSVMSVLPTLEFQFGNYSWDIDGTGSELEGRLGRRRRRRRRRIVIEFPLQSEDLRNSFAVADAVRPSYSVRPRSSQPASP